ncbi:La domain [Popillia japonica]|uniref:La domain n=1 Tax=Popillia japonica TaxID=7064 RepID=A0AAW1IWZ7_POPJA
MTDNLENKIIKQIEYYFGDINLPRDKFMQEKIKEDDGWVSLEVLLTFKRLASLTTDEEVIVKAIENSKSGLVAVSEDKKKLRRNPEKAAPELNEDRQKELRSRTAYAKGFPKTEELDDIVSFLEEYGPIESCGKRSYLDVATKENKFKGSCFIIFETVELCKKFIEAESIKYKNVELIRKWQEDYYKEKKEEVETRRNSKKQKQEAKIAKAKEENKIDIPKGTILHFTGIADDQTLTREEIKEKISEQCEMEPAFIDYKKGDTEGYIRLKNENDAVELHKKLTDGKLEIGEINLTLRVLQDEEEDEYLKKTADAVAEMRKRKGRKRKGNFNNDHNKRKRN